MLFRSLIPLTITSTLRPVNSDLKDCEHASSVLKMSIPSSPVSHTIEDPISPVVQLGHFSNGDRIHKRSHTPPPMSKSMSMSMPVPDLLIEVERIESSTDTVGGQNLSMKSGVIQKSSNPVYLDGSSRTAAEADGELYIERMSRTPLSHDNARVRPEFTLIEERSSSKGMLLHTDTPDVCIAAVTKDVSMHTYDVSTPSSTTQTIPVPYSVHEDLSSPSSSSLSTSEDNLILIKPTIRAASRKISDYVQIV